MERTNYKRLGDYIQPVDVRNRDLKVTELLGLSMTKEFRQSTSNIVGVDMSKYKVVQKNVFAFDPMSVIRVHKVPISLNENEKPIIVSPAYYTFKCIDEQQLNPKYLMMLFRRTEFDRYADFKSDAAVRGGYDWIELCETELPVPSIERQRELVAGYETITRRIRLNEQLCAKLEETAQTIYRKMFVDDIDPENLPEGWRWGTLGELGEIVGGATPLTSEKDYWTDNGIIWITPADLSSTKSKFTRKGNKDITELGYKSASTKILPKGSVLFSSRAPIGLISIVDKDLCTNQGFKSIIPKFEIGTAFTYYCLKTNKEKIAEENIGSTFDEVSGEKMKSYKIIIPASEKTLSFEELTTPIFKRQNIIERENQSLIQLLSLLLEKMGKTN